MTNNYLCCSCSFNGFGDGGPTEYLDPSDIKNAQSLGWSSLPQITNVQAWAKCSLAPWDWYIKVLLLQNFRIRLLTHPVGPSTGENVRTLALQTTPQEFHRRWKHKQMSSLWWKWKTRGKGSLEKSTTTGNLYARSESERRKTKRS